MSYDDLLIRIKTSRLEESRKSLFVPGTTDCASSAGIRPPGTCEAAYRNNRVCYANVTFWKVYPQPKSSTLICIKDWSSPFSDRVPFKALREHGFQCSNKQAPFRSIAREILRGAPQLADAARLTLGPRSKPVLIEKKWGAPIVCNNGVTIAKEFNIGERPAQLEYTMQITPEIEFQGMTGTPQIQAAIEKHVAALEQRWDRVTACRVVLKGPGLHHRTGGLYEIHIRIALPDGREVNVERNPSADKRHSDLTFAINDAFKHARRQLQDQLRSAQGQVKRHEGPPIGRVVRIDPSGEFGFLETSDGQEIYFHRNSVLDDGFARLSVGSRVTFAEEPGDRGVQASTVKPLGKHRLRV
jgi:cold shock CspA family protein